jgi:H+/Cl- antiporter ClcA
VSVWGLTAAALAGAVFGLVARAFTVATHASSAFMKRRIAYAPLRPFVGGVVLAVVVWTLGGWRYIGLGIPAIVESFAQPVPWWDFAAKWVLTVASLGSGFKGGEVTPLFFIGATLGNALAPLLQVPYPLLTAIGFVGVFAGAANTPIACTVMAVELFGTPVVLFAALACAASYTLSGAQGIYRSPRAGR